MFSIFTYVMSRVTHSEPGLPMVKSVQFPICLIFETSKKLEILGH